MQWRYTAHWFTLISFALYFVRVCARVVLFRSRRAAEIQTFNALMAKVLEVFIIYGFICYAVLLLLFFGLYIIIFSISIKFLHLLQDFCFHIKLTKMSARDRGWRAMCASVCVERWKRNENREKCREKCQTVMLVGVMSIFFMRSSFSRVVVRNCNAMNVNVNVNVTIGNLRLQIALWARMTRINNSEKLYMIGQIFFCISSALKWLCRYNEYRLYQEIELKRYKWTTKTAKGKYHPTAAAAVRDEES